MGQQGFSSLGGSDSCSSVKVIEDINTSSGHYSPNDQSGPSMLADLPGKIRNGNAGICLLGLGRVGLPLAIVLARSGLRVIGVDVDENRVSMVNEGKMPFYYPKMEDWLREVRMKETFSASTSSEESIKRSDVIIVTVGTPVGAQFALDYSQLHSIFREIARADLMGKAVIVRSTSVPGTLANIILPMLTKQSGLEPEVDFALAVCPERILEGQAHRELYELPEIVGGVGKLSARIALELFKRINPQKKILMTTPAGAELAKLFTNIFRYVNFAVSNEFAVWAEIHGEDAHDIIRIANEDYPLVEHSEARVCGWTLPRQRWFLSRQ